MQDINHIEHNLLEVITDIDRNKAYPQWLVVMFQRKMLLRWSNSRYLLQNGKQGYGITYIQKAQHRTRQ